MANVNYNKSDRHLIFEFIKFNTQRWASFLYFINSLESYTFYIKKRDKKFLHSITFLKIFSMIKNHTSALSILFIFTLFIRLFELTSLWKFRCLLFSKSYIIKTIIIVAPFKVYNCEPVCLRSCLLELSVIFFMYYNHPKFVTYFMRHHV